DREARHRRVPAERGHPRGRAPARVDAGGRARRRAPLRRGAERPGLPGGVAAHAGEGRLAAMIALRTAGAADLPAILAMMADFNRGEGIAWEPARGEAPLRRLLGD